MTRFDALILAIQNEILSQNLYAMLAKSFKNPDTSATFISLIPLEKIHEDKLRDVFAQEFPAALVKVENDAIPYLKTGDISEPEQVLEFAISREETASDAYNKLADDSTDPELKKLLKNLAHEEENHKELLLSEIQRMQGAAIWFDPSELSGLVED